VKHILTGEIPLTTVGRQSYVDKTTSLSLDKSMLFLAFLASNTSVLNLALVFYENF